MWLKSSAINVSVFPAAIFAALLLLPACAPPAAAPREARLVPMRLQASVVATTPADAAAWNLQQIGGAAPAAGSRPIVVAVLDTGADTTHPTLAGRVYPVLDVVGNDRYDGNGGVTDFTGRDGNGHGTHVAGVVLDVAGPADVRVLPVKVIPHTGVGDDRLLSNGIERALSWRDADDASLRVRVINLSVSSPESSDRLIKAIRKATAAGVIVVGAAGNEAKAVEFPATMTEVLTVGATNVAGNWATYSCFGDEVDLVAPGGSDVMPVVAAWPTYLTASDMDSGRAKPHRTAGLVGTSMAAPHVSGAAAALWGERPGLTAAQVRARMLAAAEDLGRPGADPKYGFGRLNLARALEVDGHDAR